MSTIITIVNFLVGNESYYKPYEGTLIGFGWARIVFWAVMIMIIVGIFRGKKRIFSDRTHNIIIAGTAAVFTYKLMKSFIDEVADAAIKWCDLHILSWQDSSAWSVIIALGTIFVVSVIFGLIIFYASWFIGERKNIWAVSTRK